MLLGMPQLQRRYRTHDSVGQQVLISIATPQRRSSVSAVDQLEQNLSAKTSQATAEGEANVQGYVAQAKNLASSALATAQVSDGHPPLSVHTLTSTRCSHIFLGQEVLRVVLQIQVLPRRVESQRLCSQPPVGLSGPVFRLFRLQERLWPPTSREQQML